MPKTPVRQKNTKPVTKRTGGSGGKHQTILFNCNCHTFDSVISQLIYALNCSYEAARRYAHVTHTNGQATVYTGTQEKCDDVADKLAEIGLRVRVT